MFHSQANNDICRHSSVVEHVIGNDGVVSPILTGGTIFLLSPYFKGFFYALFSAHFNMHVGVTRLLRRQTYFIRNEKLAKNGKLFLKTSQNVKLYSQI